MGLSGILGGGGSPSGADPRDEDVGVSELQREQEKAHIPAGSYGDRRQQVRPGTDVSVGHEVISFSVLLV